MVNFYYWGRLLLTAVALITTDTLSFLVALECTAGAFYIFIIFLLNSIRFL